jgi:carboxyl-terminal processing protease
MALNGSPSGLSVMSATPGGPAENSGILPGDVILAIDNRSTEDMDIYDAAQRLQGPEGSSVDLDIRSGSNTRHVVLKRQTVTLNPVRSRMCEIPGAKDNSKVGYIKLTTFNQNAAGSVKEALQKLRENNVKSFVLDLRNNRFGLAETGLCYTSFYGNLNIVMFHAAVAFFLKESKLQRFGWTRVLLYTYVIARVFVTFTRQMELVRLLHRNLWSCWYVLLLLN